MHLRSHIRTILALATLVALFAAGDVRAQQPKAKQEPGPTTQLELTISKDGRSIVDQNGRIIARFVKGMRVQSTKNKGLQMTTKDVSAKLQGCMRCTRECYLYNQAGRCIGWTQSCTWDFDC